MLENKWRQIQFSKKNPYRMVKTRCDTHCHILAFLCHTEYFNSCSETLIGCKKTYDELFHIVWIDISTFIRSQRTVRFEYRMDAYVVSVEPCPIPETITYRNMKLIKYQQQPIGVVYLRTWFEYSNTAWKIF